VHNREIAEDIVQDSFASLWVNRGSLDIAYPLQPYLYSILRNRSINVLKRLALDQKIMSEITKREYRANIAALSDDSADTVIKFQLEEFINKAYLELPAKISSSFTDSRIKGMTYQEIADKKGVSVKVVEYHITQALKHFKIRLKEFLE
jgi:RNA polymerase sigma-70 factor (ECF subfamily)